MWTLNGELAYRPDNVLMTDYAGQNANADPSVVLFGFNNGGSGEEHDTVSASVHSLGWYGGGPLGIDTNLYMVQLGVDYIEGDLDNLLSNYAITTYEMPNPDSAAWGIAAQWDATWQNAIINNLNVTTSLFLQYDFSGNSHYWGNFVEDRLMSSFGVTGNYGSAWEANITYARTDFTSDEVGPVLGLEYGSVYEKQDTVNFALNYKF
jgi:hypothetical protein